MDCMCVFVCVFAREYVRGCVFACIYVGVCVICAMSSGSKINANSISGLFYSH